VNVVGAATLLVLMRRRLGFEHAARTAGVVLRIVLAGIVAAAAAYLAWYALDEALGDGFASELVSVAAGLTAAALGYVAASRALGIRELDTLLLLRARREDSSE
jgi:peptidoglycan biosynthesis protein MviN/MurJ (putative lipid II flippase)